MRAMRPMILAEDVPSFTPLANSGLHPATRGPGARRGAVLLVIDGLRPDAIAAAHTPNLHRLMREGAHTLQARSVMPCITLPVHLSMVTSVPPQVHGVLENVAWHQPRAELCSLFDLAHAEGLQVAAFFNWEHLRALAAPGSLSASHYVGPATKRGTDQQVAHMAAPAVRRAEADLLFIYFGELDETGHAHGWMSPAYLRVLEEADRALGTVLEAVTDSAGEYDLLMVSDHGGHGHHHGTDLPEDMTVPWMAWGPAMAAGRQISQPVSLLDVAPTLASLLGLPPHPSWQGRVVDVFASLDLSAAPCF